MVYNNHIEASEHRKGKTMLICNNSTIIKAVQQYVNRIKNAEKRRYADDLWCAIYNESAGNPFAYPDTSKYTLGAMGVQAVQMRIREIIDEGRV